MDLTSKMLRDVEFRDRLRGYDTDEVDEFLERVAVGIDELQAELIAARTAQPTAPAAPVPAPAPVAPVRSAIEDDDSIKRTLVLAQRTADLAIAEAKAEADDLLERARTESEQLVSEAQEAASRLESAAEVDLRERVTRLTDEREVLEHDVRTLTSLVEGERSRLVELISSLAGQVSAIGVSDAFGAVASARPERPSEPESAPESSPPPFLADDPDAADGLDEAASDLDLDLDLSITPQAERPVTAPTPVYQPPTETAAAEPDVDEALWERWASSGDADAKRADDPFQFGPSEE